MFDSKDALFIHLKWRNEGSSSGQEIGYLLTTLEAVEMNPSLSNAATATQAAFDTLEESPVPNLTDLFNSGPLNLLYRSQPP